MVEVVVVDVVDVVVVVEVVEVVVVVEVVEVVEVVVVVDVVVVVVGTAELDVLVVDGAVEILLSAYMYGPGAPVFDGTAVPVMIAQMPELWSLR